MASIEDAKSAYTAAQLARAPSAWLPNGDYRTLYIVELPTVAIRSYEPSSVPLRRPLERACRCPVIDVALHGLVLVVLPDGSAVWTDVLH